MMADNEDHQSQEPKARSANTAIWLKIPALAAFINRPRLVFGLLTVAIFILLITGIYCLLYDVTVETMEHEERYDQCIDPERNRSCGTFKPGPTLPKCTCILEFEVKSLIKGKVTMYYELESFDQKNSTYANSRDNDQLMGNPGLVPAQSCGDYSYFDNKTIFPCGEVADSMFNDTFIHLKRTDSEPKEKVPVSYTKLFTDDTPEFKNPPPDVLNNFSTPKNWRIDEASGIPLKPWESITELKGIENPAFRAWMDTNLKRKPVWRLDDMQDSYRQGLPPGNYSLKIYMFYGVDRYNGTRKIILEGVKTNLSTRNPAGGVVSLLMVLVLFLLIVFVYYRYRNFAQKVSAPNHTDTDAITDRPANEEREVPLLNRIRNTFTEFRT